jgi:putative flippase GtrA
MIREGRDFVLVGLAQCLVDATVMIAANHLGAPIYAANVAGRIAGASLGFWLNGAITFPAGAHESRSHLIRYGILWLAACWLSTVGVVLLNRTLGRHWAWLGKPVIDGLLGFGSFVASRNWVYR